ncbi:LuxR C-terminal-related transcriptional regulator [Kitasatospora sp. NPDC093679]|uniref:LuxR C-terminal-related transcriptional regulator n=1 Tax=Kitasatospora sp. NPDC093679 TaxID=3154983 RepID=UPI00341280C5
MIPTAPAPAPARAAFSRRELEVLELLVEGASYAAIARRLELSPHTVDTYLRRIRAKTGATNQIQLTLLACRVHGLPTAA